MKTVLDDIFRLQLIYPDDPDKTCFIRVTGDGQSLQVLVDRLPNNVLFLRDSAVQRVANRETLDLDGFISLGIQSLFAMTPSQVVDGVHMHEHAWNNSRVGGLIEAHLDVDLFMALCKAIKHTDRQFVTNTLKAMSVRNVRQVRVKAISKKSLKIKRKKEG